MGAPRVSSSIEGTGAAGTVHDDETEAAIQLTDEQLLLMSQRYRQRRRQVPGLVTLTDADLLELLRDVAGRGWRNRPDGLPQSVEEHLQAIVEELRQLAEALMLTHAFEDAQRVLGALTHVNMVTDLDEFERIQWPPEVYTERPGAPRELRWLAAEAAAASIGRQK